MRANKFEISNFICPDCGKSFPLPRAKATRREKGHIKDLYCPFCKKTVKAFEIRPRDAFATLDSTVVYY